MADRAGGVYGSLLALRWIVSYNNRGRGTAINSDLVSETVLSDD